MPDFHRKHDPAGDAPSELERLISRHLDNEATDSERRRLDRALDADPRARAYFEESAALDRELHQALRWAGRQAGIVRTRPARGGLRLGMVAGLGLAACLAGAFWLLPTSSLPVSGGGSPTHAGQVLPASGSWFAPPPVGDTFISESSASAPPHIRVEDTQREWIVVPGHRAGEYLILEVKRIRAKQVRIERDF
jgi:hypothetical protein